ncbi:MAG TPA: response regulator transcription factor [Acidimicrobiales bacterium]|jgi:DNA-binding NarL/FixJ family response regulator|nr:response regulator transcription factor [Acidimicrobiales bacterium]
MRIILGDGPELVAMSLTKLFEEHGHQVVAATAEPTELAGLVEQHHPDVCVLEVATPREEPIDAAMRSIRACAGHTDVVVVTGAELSLVSLEALSSGASAVVSKSSDGDDLVAQVERRVARTPQRRKPGGRDRYFLTEREQEVLACLADGDSTARISTRLHLSQATVRSHVQSLLCKLGVHSRSGAVAVGVRTGLIHRCA